MVLQACNPSTSEVEAGGLEFQCHPWLQREFEIILNKQTNNQLKKKTCVS